MKQHTGGPCWTFAQVDAVRKAAERMGLAATCLKTSLEDIMVLEKVKR